MDHLIIFGAKYLWVASAAVAIYAFYISDSKKSFIKSAVFILPIAYIAGIIARALYYNPRPFVENGVTPLIEHAADNGFPSDHTLLVASLAALVTIYSRKLGLALWAITLVVATSRVLAGVHHTIDVLASILISIVIALMVYFLNNSKRNATDNTRTAE